MPFYKETVVQILEDDCIKAKLDWTGFSPGRTSKVKQNWTRDDNAPQLRRVTDYNYDDNICINFHSIGRDIFFVRVQFNDDPTPETADSCTSYKVN